MRCPLGDTFAITWEFRKICIETLFLCRIILQQPFRIVIPPSIFVTVQNSSTFTGTRSAWKLIYLAGSEVSAHRTVSEYLTGTILFTQYLISEPVDCLQSSK